MRWLRTRRAVVHLGLHLQFAGEVAQRTLALYAFEIGSYASRGVLGGGDLVISDEPFRDGQGRVMLSQFTDPGFGPRKILDVAQFSATRCSCISVNQNQSTRSYRSVKATTGVLPSQSAPPSMRVAVK